MSLWDLILWNLWTACGTGAAMGVGIGLVLGEILWPEIRSRICE